MGRLLGTTPRRRFPTPLTTQFWRLYGEPVEWFYLAGSLFRDVVRALAEPSLRHAATDEDGDESSDVAIEEENKIEQAREHRRALQRLNALAAPIAQAVIASENPMAEYEYRWRSPSLLATYAHMVRQDLLSYRLISCSECGRLRVVRHEMARYCSETCSWRAQKRAQRRRHTADGKTGE